MNYDIARETLGNSGSLHLTYATERYTEILSSVALAPPDTNIEIYLTEAFELGRAMVDKMIPPDELTNIHHIGIMALVQSHPNLYLSQVAERLTRPLMEMSMSYGMAFRQQMERRYESMINIRLEESRKLEAVGTLAAGIAHDFNNLLGSIVGFTEMAGDRLKNDPLGESSIHQILNASFRARDLVARLLTFARQGKVELIEVDIVNEVQEAIALLRASLLPSVEIKFSTTLENAKILADVSQIHQIIMNLSINAADAMNDHGIIIIKLEAVEEVENVGNMEVVSINHSKNSQKICLTVSDTGSSIPPEILQRIFDPFYTTKAPGKGSGLGLSVVYGIVTGLGGAIQVASQKGRGTEFRIILPLLAPHQ